MHTYSGFDVYQSSADSFDTGEASSVVGPNARSGFNIGGHRAAMLQKWLALIPKLHAPYEAEAVHRNEDRVASVTSDNVDRPKPQA